MTGSSDAVWVENQKVNRNFYYANTTTNLGFLFVGVMQSRHTQLENTIVDDSGWADSYGDFDCPKKHAAQGFYKTGW